MKCPRCERDNPSTAKFCQECGTALGRACRACGKPLPEGSRFCPECAHPVEDAAPAASPAREQAPADKGERRQATVLFADITGYTQLCASTDAEQVQALLNRFFSAMDGTVAAYGGKVIDHAGDGVLAAFGAPVAYGNDAERAVRAALEMHAVAAQLRDPGGHPLRLHIGIASGEVVAAVLSGGATPRYAVTGEPVNLAARLDALAAGGETLLSQAVHANVTNLVEVDDLGEKPVKGFAAPKRVYRVRGLRQSAGSRLPFVGRLNELRQLTGTLQGTRESGRGMALVLRGDPGIGKSRLVEELCWRAQAQGFVWQVARVLDFGVAKDQAALPAAVAALLGLPAHADSAARRSALDRALESGLVDAAHEAPLAGLLGCAQRADLGKILDAMDSETRTRRTVQALTGLVANAVRAQPRLIVFEDIHWAAADLLGCLAALTLATRDVPLILVMTTRFDGDPLDRQWRAASQGTPLLTIDLGPLRPEEALAMAGGVVESSNRFALNCIERAEGNPLFLEQLLRNITEGEGSTIPPTIQSLVLARMDRLQAQDKLALQAASVIGKRFSLAGVRHLMEDPGYVCDVLVRSDLIRPDAGDYLFAHALIQEGVYSSLLKSRKRELHARAAHWYGEREPVLKAEHLDRAEHADAARAYLVAAQDEMRRLGLDTALRLAQRGAELAQESALRREFAMLRGAVLRETGHTHESIAAFAQALELAGNDDEQRCLALIGIAAGHRITSAMQEAMAALDLAQPIAERLQLAGARSHIHSMRGNLYFARGKVAACGAEHQSALEHARQAADVECEAQAWSGLGDHAYAQGRMHTALGHFRRCVELNRHAGLLRREIPNLCMVGHCLGWLGEAQASLDEIRRALALADRIGLPQAQVMTLESLAFALVFQGDYGQAEPWAEKATAAARRASARRYLAVGDLLLAACKLARGQRDEAQALLTEAFAISEQTGMGFVGASLYALQARLERDPEARHRALVRGEALLDDECLAHSRLMFYRDAITLALEDRRCDEATRYADAMEQSFRAEPMLFVQFTVAKARALVALAREGPQRAVIAELTHLRSQLQDAGFGALTHDIDAALAAA